MMDLSDESDAGLADSFYDDMASPELRDEIFEEIRGRLDSFRDRLQRVEEEQGALCRLLQEVREKRAFHSREAGRAEAAYPRAYHDGKCDAYHVVQKEIQALLGELEQNSESA